MLMFMLEKVARDIAKMWPLHGTLGIAFVVTGAWQRDPWMVLGGIALAAWSVFTFKLKREMRKSDEALRGAS